MKTVYDALDPIVNGSATTKEKGDKYEAACVYYPLIINFIRTLPTFIRTCADECGNPIP